MAKLYFRYGTVGSAKTLNLLAVAHNYEQQGKRCFIIKPALDIRFGAELVASRAGLERKADLCLKEDQHLPKDSFEGIDCVVVDEVQFLAPYIIDELHQLAYEKNIPVICYGLRTDFRRGLFDGAKRLLELADSIEEVKTTCHYCNRKAVFNLKLADGIPTVSGPTIDLGAEEKYLPTCAKCFAAKLKEAGVTSLVS